MLFPTVQLNLTTNH